MFCRNTSRTGNKEYQKILKKVLRITLRWSIPAKTICNQILVHIKQEKALFASKLVLYLRKKLVKCYVWTIVLYSAET
jgi:uncharacterized protein with WD repeat